LPGINLLNPKRKAVDVLENVAYKTHNYHAGNTNAKPDFCYQVISKGWDGYIRFHDKHGLYNEQIIIQGDDGVDYGNQYEDIKTFFGGSRKEEELSKETSHRRDTSQRKHTEHHDQTEAGIGFVKTVVVFDILLIRKIANCGNNAKGAKVRKDINHNVINNRSHSKLVATNHPKKDKSGL